MFFEIDNDKYNVILEKKHNKNLYIRVDDNLSIKVTYPFLYTKKMVLKILEENKLSIKKMIEKQTKKNNNKIKEENLLLGKKIDNVFENKKEMDIWYKKKSLEIFSKYIDEIYNIFEENIPYPKLKVRMMKTRWGVCNRRDNSVTLNLQLIKMNDKYLKYVIVHELSHFIHFNHSKSFWNLVEKYCPNYKELRKEMRLHA